MIGLLGVYLTTPHPWQPEEIDLLRSVAYQLAIALTRSSLFERAHRQAERLALLHSITAAIRSSLEPTTLFHAITQQIGAAFQADVCILALWQPEQEMLHPVGIYAPELTPAVRVSGTEPLLDAPLTGSLQKPWPEPGIPPELSETVQAKLRLAASLLTTLKEPVVVPDDLKPQRQGSGLLWVPLFASDQPQRQQEVLGVLPCCATLTADPPGSRRIWSWRKPWPSRRGSPSNRRNFTSKPASRPSGKACCARSPSASAAPMIPTKW